MALDIMAQKANFRNRREVLKTTAGLGVVGLAGCMGENNGGSLVMGTAAEVSANYAMMSGLGSVVNENTDDVQLDVRPSDSMAANVGRMEGDEIDIGLLENTTAHDVQQGDDPFDEVETEFQMIAHGSTSDWFLIAEDDQLSSLDDIGPDNYVAPGPEGSRVTEMASSVLEMSGIEYEERTTEYGDMGPGISEGRIDVGIASNMNVLIDPVEPGWVQEIHGNIDGRILGMSDELFENVQDEAGISSFEFEPTNSDAWDYTPDPVRSMSQITWIYGTSETPDEQVRAMVETMYEHRDEMGEYHDLLSFYEEDDHWTNEPHKGFEIHPAAAEFYEEEGLM